MRSSTPRSDPLHPAYVRQPCQEVDKCGGNMGAQRLRVLCVQNNSSYYFAVFFLKNKLVSYRLIGVKRKTVEPSGRWHHMWQNQLINQLINRLKQNSSFWNVIIGFSCIYLHFSLLNQNTPDPEAVSRGNRDGSQRALYGLKGPGGQSANNTGPVGFVEKLKTIAGPCESLCGEVLCGWSACENHGGFTHSIQGFDPLKEMATRTCTHTHSTNKQEKREGTEGRRPMHCKNPPPKTEDYVATLQDTIFSVFYFIVEVSLCWSEA